MGLVIIQGAGGSGKPEEEKSVVLALAEGDQIVNPTSGKTMKKVTIQKPDTLVPGNIKEGVVIAGVTGTHAGGAKPESAPDITLDMSNGDQTVTPESGYVFSSVKIKKPATFLAENIKEGVVIAGITGTHSSSSTIPNDLDGLVDGTITAFLMPTGRTSIYKNRFQNMTSLTSADLGSATSVGDYAFDGCTNLGTLTLPSSITSVGQYAFRNVGSNKNTPFIFTADSPCTIGTYGFSGAKIAKVSGKLSTVNTYGFSSCTALLEIDLTQCGTLNSYAFNGCSNLATVSIKITGAVNDYAFYGCNAVASHALDPTSAITALGNYAFSRYGSGRANASSNIQVFDFTNSTFTAVNTYAFGSDSSSYKNKYQKIRFPSTVTSVKSYAFRYSDYCDFYFDSTTPPTLQDGTAWSNATNYNIFVPYDKVNAYRSATNWTAQTAYIKGYAKGNTFSVGDTLPEVNSEGYELTWYSDKACTTAITTVSDATAELYCVAGATKVVFQIASVSATDCTITITDGTNTYSQGDSVRRNTVLTITGTPTTTGWVPYTFKVNGADFTSGDTVTVTSDISVTAIYYDGQDVPVDPVFANNDWETIRQVVRAGTASQFWSVGDTKSITLTNGATIVYRIADMKTGRYALSDNTGSSNMVLEPVTQIPNTTAAMNSSGSNSGGFAQSQMRSTTLANIYALFPTDVQNAMSEVVILSGTGGGTTSGTSSSNNKLFLPAETEMFSSATYSIGSSESPSGQFDYYAAHNTAADRIKQRDGSNKSYWLRSPYSGYSSYFCYVTNTGNADLNDAYNASGVAPCFAI